MGVKLSRANDFLIPSRRLSAGYLVFRYTCRDHPRHRDSKYPESSRGLKLRET